MSLFDKNFLICPGVEKCGTTSLYSFLQDRDEIILPKVKETFFFNTHYNKGIEYYEDLFGFKENTPPTNNGYYADITPSYFRGTKPFDRIKEDLKGNKTFIFLIRNPVKRAFSFYWHDLVRHISKGEKSAGEFKTFRNFSFAHFIAKKDSYFLTPYYEHLSKWMKAFPEQVIVHTIDEVIKDPDILIHSINNHSDLSLETGRAYPKENSAWVANLTIFPDGIRRHDEQGIKIMSMEREHAINAMAIQGTFTHYLPKRKCEKIYQDFFAEDIEKCEALLKRDLPEFKQQSNLMSPIVKSYQNTK